MYYNTIIMLPSRYPFLQWESGVEAGVLGDYYEAIDAADCTEQPHSANVCFTPSPKDTVPLQSWLYITRRDKAAHTVLAIC